MLAPRPTSISTSGRRDYMEPPIPPRQHPFVTGELAIYIVAQRPDAVARVLSRILRATTKRFQLPATSSFSGAFKHADRSPLFATVAMIVSDRPVDCQIASPNGVPYWREAISAFRRRYQEVFQLERKTELLPDEFSVISLMPMNRGKLKSKELDEVTGPLPELDELDVEHHVVESLREAALVLAEQVMPRVIRRGDLDLNVSEEEEEDGQVLPAWNKVGKPATGGMHFRQWRDTMRDVD